MLVKRQHHDKASVHDLITLTGYVALDTVYIIANESNISVVLHVQRWMRRELDRSGGVTDSVMKRVIKEEHICLQYSTDTESHVISAVQSGIDVT